MNRQRGFTLIELLTVMAIIALLVGLLLPALAQARAKALMTKDATQIKQIHAAWTTFSRDYDGIFPTPGLINRLAVNAGTLTGQIPGRGDEDLEANNSAYMYSACIMQNYFTPQILVGPTEPSAFVAVKDDYDWSVYSPNEDIYWDADDNDYTPPSNSNVGDNYRCFSVDLDGSDPELQGVSNTSYAHSPISGQRKVKEWRDSLNSKWAVIGNRGPAAGAAGQTSGCANCPEYVDSITLEFHGGSKQWIGNIGFNDNHVALIQSVFPEGLNYDLNGEPEPDHLFYNDEINDCSDGRGNDIWLTLISDIQTDGFSIISECD